MPSASEVRDLQERLSRFLAETLGSGLPPEIVGLERRPGGASRESWAFDAVWREGGETRVRRCILRRDPPGSLLGADKTVRAFEFRVLEAVASRGIPAPRPYALDADGRWLERPSLVMERVEGQPTPLPTYPADGDPEIRKRLAEQFPQILARIHRLDWKANELDRLGVPAPGTEAAARQVELWQRTYERDRLEPQPVLDEAFRWLREHLPSVERIALVHGDFRSGNYLYDASGRITAMLDWELAHLGDPMEDLGWAVMRFWSGGGLAVGLLPREELFARYEAAGGEPVDRERVFFYEVLGNAKMATIALTGVRAFVSGSTPHVLHGIVGFLVPRLLEDLAAQLGL